MIGAVRCELRVVGGIDSFVAELLADLVHAVQTPDNEPLEVQPALTKSGLNFFILESRRVLPPAYLVLRAKHISNPILATSYFKGERCYNCA